MPTVFSVSMQPEASEEEVKAEMRRRLNSSASEETVKGEVKDGDTVIVSWYGTINEAGS